MAFTPKLGKLVTDEEENPTQEQKSQPFVPKLGKRVEDESATSTGSEAPTSSPTPEDAAEPTASERPTFGRIWGWAADSSKKALEAGQGFGTGAMKGILNLPFQAAKLGSAIGEYGAAKAKGVSVDQLREAKARQDGTAAKISTGMDEGSKVPEVFKPHGTAEKAGYEVEKFAENFVPVFGTEKAAVNAAARLTKNAPRLLQYGAKLATRMGYNVVDVAAKTAMQDGDVKTASLLAGAFPVVADLLKGGGRLATIAAKQMSSTMSGVPKEAIEHAFQNPDAVRQGLQRMADDPSFGPEAILKEAEDALDAIEDSRRIRYQTDLGTAQKNMMRTQKGQLYVQKVVTPDDVRRGMAAESAIGKTSWVPTDVTTKGVKDTITNTLKEFDVKTTKDGLNFSTSRLENHQPDIEKIKKMVYEWEDVSPLGLDKLRQKVDDYAITMPSRASDKQFNSFVTALRQNINGYVDDRVPDIAKMRGNYAEASQFIDRVKKELRLDNKNPVTAMRKLMNVFSPKSAVYRDMVKELGEKGSKDLMSDVAAMVFSSWTPEGLAKYFSSAGALLGGAATLMNPAALPGAIATGAMSSPKLVGKAVTRAGQVAKSKAAQKAASAVAPMTRAAIIESSQGDE